MYRSDLKTNDEANAVLSGHRPIVFSDVEGKELLPDEAMDVLLLCGNRIVASTARRGRYAVGTLFYVRSPQKYHLLQQACRQMSGGTPLFTAFAHNRSIVLVSGALLRDTDLMVAVVLHGNVKRARRVMQHYFADVITWRDEVTPEGGLRRGDEAFYHGFCEVIRLFRRLLGGCGSTLEITKRAQLITLLFGRITELLRLFPAITLTDGDENRTDVPYPCLGEVNISHTVASLLCLLLAARDCFARCTLRMTVSEEDMYPHFTLTAIERLDGAPRLDAHPAIAEGMRLSLRGATQFKCVAVDNKADVWQILFSPMRARYGEMYTLRSDAVWEQA